MEQVAQSAIVPYHSPRSGLIVDDKKQFVALRGFKTNALLEILTSAKYVGRFAHVDELTRIFDGRVAENGRRAMRRRMVKAYHDFRDQGYLLLKNIESGNLVSVKICDAADDNDKILAKQQLETMRKRNEDSLQGLEKAAAIAGISLSFDFMEG